MPKIWEAIDWFGRGDGCGCPQEAVTASGFQAARGDASRLNLSPEYSGT